MRRDPNQKFQFELTRSDNTKGATFSLVVIDNSSGAAVLESEFNAEQFANLISSRLTSEEIPTWFSPSPYRDRIGKHLGVISRIVSHPAARSEDVVKEWADQVRRFAIPCDEVDGPGRRGGGGGYRVMFRRYFDTAAEAAEWETKQGQLLADLPSPADLAKGFRFAASLAAYSAETSSTEES
jgi:hypothetical protein